MNMIRLIKEKLNIKSSRSGSTLIEMVVSFTLLAIFLSTATVIISNVTNLYYHVRGESYARQVGDIVTQKIVSEISGARYSATNNNYNPVIYTESELSVGDGEKVVGNSIAFYDGTDTRVRIFASGYASGKDPNDDGIFQIFYYPIKDETDSTNDRVGTYWGFDKKIYNGYKITRMNFAQANTSLNEQLAAEYNIADVHKEQYPSNVMAVYMTLKSEKYGEYNICRFVKMYDYPEDVDDFIIKASEN